jgi:hypothetical protein
MGGRVRGPLSLARAPGSRLYKNAQVFYLPLHRVGAKRTKGVANAARQLLEIPLSTASKMEPMTSKSAPPR